MTSTTISYGYSRASPIPVYHNAAINVSVNDNNNDEFSEGVPDEHQAKENIGTIRKINFQEVALHLEMKTD